MGKSDHRNAQKSVINQGNQMNTQTANTFNDIGSKWNNQTQWNQGQNLQMQGNLAAYKPTYSFTGNSGGSSGGAMPGLTPGMSSDQVRQAVSDYYSSRGVTPNASSVDYWTQKYSDPTFAGDTNYFNQRLSQADEFGGGGGGGFIQGPQMDLSFLNNFGSDVRPQYQNFANTGGFSDADIANMRARNISPTVGMYQNMKDELSRRQAISGGNLANFGASQANLGRQSAQQVADTNVNTNAGLAQMVQQGKMFGTSGLSGLDTAEMQARLGGGEANLNAAMGMAGIQSQQEMAANQNQLAGLGLGNQLYGMNLGAGENYGNMLIGAQGQQIQQGLGNLQAGLGANQVPTGFQSAMGGLGSLFGLGGQIGGAFGGAGWGMGQQLPSSGIPGNYNNYSPTPGGYNSGMMGQYYSL